MDKMREEFEEFIAKEFQFSDQPRNDGSYRCTKINDLWKSWKASRAALCIFIPSGIRESHFIEIISQLRSSGANWS